MKYLLLILIFLSNIAFSQGGGIDTFTFGNKEYLLRRLNTNYNRNSGCFPFQIFKVKYSNMVSQYSYFGLDSCDCPSFLSYIEYENGDLVGFYKCGSRKSGYQTITSVIDSFSIELNNQNDELILKEGKYLYNEFMIQAKLISNNETKLVSFKTDMNTKLFATLSREIKLNPSINLIIIDQIYYYDFKKELYVLPFRIMFNPI